MRVCGPCRTVGMSSTGHLLRSLRDPRTGETLDARIRDARVRLAPPGALTPEPGETVLDAEGRWLIPGLWDRHVHVDQWAQARTRLDLTAADSADTGECGPPIASCASRRSVATFSPCIMVVRRLASSVSSPSFGASAFSSCEA